MSEVTHGITIQLKPFVMRDGKKIWSGPKCKTESLAWRVAEDKRREIESAAIRKAEEGAE